MKEVNINKIIEEINSELKVRYSEFQGTYFYGSRARGDYNEDSDIDVVLLFDKQVDRKLKGEISSIILDIELENDVIIDEHAYFVQDIHNPITPFRKRIHDEGIFYGI